MVSKKEQERQFQRIVDKVDIDIRRAFIQSLNKIKGEINLSEIERLIDSGDIDAVADLLNTDFIGNNLFEFNQAIEDGFALGGKQAAIVATASQVPIRFNILNTGTAAFLDQYQDQLIRAITSDQRETIISTVRAGVLSGDGPRTTARRVRENIGLTPHQLNAVDNFEQLLLANSSASLSRQLRDKRFDGTIRRAIRDKEKLTQAQRDKMVRRYKERFIKHRSVTIARTESIRAVSAGQQRLWQQAVDEGRVLKNQLKREWLPTYDGKLRDSHAAIPSMNPDGVGLDEPFESPEGLIMFPGDPSASAANTINCRCTVITRIVTNANT